MRGSVAAWVATVFAALVAAAPQAGAVVGGEAASPRQWPWVVQVAALSDTDGAVACTGVVVAPRWVLTAAHCLRGVRPRLAAVAAPGGAVRGAGVRAVVPHPAAEGITHDLGLLRLAQPLAGPVAPLAGASAAELVDHGGVVVGFGWRVDADPGRELRTGHQRVAGPSACGGAAPPPGTYCVGGTGDQAAACHGDSGGAFVVDGRVVGLVAGGEDPCRPGVLGFHTDLGAHAAWIGEVVGRRGGAEHPQ